MTESRYHLRTLGPPELRDASGRAMDGIRSRDLAVLAYLARAAGRSTSREALAALFWESGGSGAARGALRQTIYRLRRVLGDALDADAREVRLAAGALDVDADLFERDLEAGCPEAAVRRWEGDFLERLEDAGGGDFRVWLEASRQALRTRHERALATLIDRADAAGSMDVAVEWAERWQRCAPLSETPLIRLCELLRRSGRTVDALARLRAAEVRLRDGGAEPSDALLEIRARLEARTASGDGEPGAIGPGALLSPELVGRGRVLERLRLAWESARSSTARPVLLEGEEGIGKTRLGEEFLRRTDGTDEPPLVLRSRAAPQTAQPPGPGAVPQAAARLFSPLRGARGLSGASERALAELAGVVPSIGERFAGLPAASGSATALLAGVREVLACVAAETPLILFLDDLPLLDAPSRALLVDLASDPPPRTLILATARPSATSIEAGDVAAPDLVGWTRIRLALLSRTEARELIASMLELAPAELDFLTERLHRESRGNPLFLVQLVSALVDERRLLAGPSGIWHLDEPHAPLPLPSDIRAILVRRLARLDPAARRALSVAAVLDPPFAAGRMLQMAELEGGEAASALHELLARRLLQESPTDPGSYELRHEAVRRVALEILAPEDAASLMAPRPVHAAASRVLRRRSMAALVAIAVVLAVAAGAMLLRPAPGAPPSLAVHRLQNLSPDSTDAYLAAGLAEELAGRLGKLEHLRVLSPTATEHVEREQKQDAWGLLAACALGADYMVEGSIQRSGDEVRVVVRLTACTTEYSSGARATT